MNEKPEQSSLNRVPPRPLHPNPAATMKPEQPETQVGNVKYDTIVCVQYCDSIVQVYCQDLNEGVEGESSDGNQRGRSHNTDLSRRRLDYVWRSTENINMKRRTDFQP